MLSELDDAVRSMVRRAAIDAVHDDGEQQLVDARGLARDKFERIHRAQDYGVSSNPPAGSEGLLLALGGRSDRVAMLGTYSAKDRRKNLPAGGVALHDNGKNVHKLLGPDGQVIYSAGDVKFWRKQGKKIYLGGNPDDPAATFAPVMTSSGPSPVVYAIVNDPEQAPPA